MTSHKFTLVRSIFYNSVIQSKVNIYTNKTKSRLMTSQKAITILGNCEKTEILKTVKPEEKLIQVSSMFTDTELTNLNQNKVCFFVEYENKYYEQALNLHWQDRQIPQSSKVLRNDQDNSILTINAVSGG